MLAWCRLSQKYQQDSYMEFIKLGNLDQEFRGEIWAVSIMKPFFRSQGNELNFLANSKSPRNCSVYYSQVVNLLFVVKRAVSKSIIKF